MLWEFDEKNIPGRIVLEETNFENYWNRIWMRLNLIVAVNKLIDVEKGTV